MTLNSEPSSSTGRVLTLKLADRIGSPKPKAKVSNHSVGVASGIAAPAASSSGVKVFSTPSTVLGLGGGTTAVSDPSILSSQGTHHSTCHWIPGPPGVLGGTSPPSAVEIEVSNTAAEAAAAAQAETLRCRIEYAQREAHQRRLAPDSGSK